ncbi:MAG: cupin domain-containing protein [Candidatus Neomarinimicrobiota bacterium]
MNSESKRLKKRDYSNTIVKKPWGFEYLVYQNENIALWYLFIKYDNETSMHCHPNKTTGLIVLDGEVEVSFLGNTFKSGPLSKIMIRKGLFHSTRSISKEGSHVFEIETPVDKHDLIRLEDKYGREGSPYEDETFEAPKRDDCLWIKEPKNGDSSDYFFYNCKIHLKTISDLTELKILSPQENIMFLNGGIITSDGKFVAQAGDVVKGDVLMKLAELFPKVAPDTTYMKITRDE